MKTLLLLGIIGLFSLQISAQQFTVTNDSMFKTGTALQSEIICYNFVTNTSADTLTMAWVRIEKNLPTGWKSQICDINLCYWFDINTQTFEIPADSTYNIDVHFWPEDIAGDGEIEIILYVVGDSANTAHTSYYKASATPVGISSVEDLNISLSPNPVKDIFSLSGIEKLQDAQIKIFDLLGNTLNIPVDLGQAGVDVSQLPKGLYFLQLNSAQYGLTKTIRFEKL